MDFTSTNRILENCISVKAAAKYSGYSPQYLRRLLRIGNLTGLKLGQLWLIKMESLDFYFGYALNSSDQRFSPRKRSVS